MKYKIVWCNLYPGGFREPKKTKEGEINDPFVATPGDVEKTAIMDTPTGYYLSEIIFPGITYHYTTKGKKSIKTNNL